MLNGWLPSCITRRCCHICRLSREERLFGVARDDLEAEIDIVDFLKKIRKLDGFYETLGNKWLSERTKARLPYKLAVLSSDEDYP